MALPPAIQKAHDALVAQMNAQGNALNQSLSADDSFKIIDEMGQGERKRIDDTYKANLGTILSRLQGRGLGTSSQITPAALAVSDKHQQGMLSLADMLLSKKLGVGEAAKDRLLQRSMSLANRQTGTSSILNQRQGGGGFGGGGSTPSAYAAQTPDTPEWNAMRSMYNQFWGGMNTSLVHNRPNLTNMLNQIRGV